MLYWSGLGGRWTDPAIWREGAFNEEGRLIATAPATHAPESDDDVMFINGYAPGVQSYDLGPIIGGGSADEVFTQVDFGAIPLRGDFQGGFADEYRFNSVDLNDRILSVGEGATLFAGELDIDRTSTLSISSGWTTIDTHVGGGVTYTARIGDLTVEGPHPGGTHGGKIDLGNNNVVANTYRNDNPDGVTSTGGRVIVIDPANPPEPEPVDWNAVAARVEAWHALTGRWEDPGPGWHPDPHTGNPPIQPEPTDWEAIAAQVQANYEATGTWWW
jgi:hypothetical protein